MTRARKAAVTSAFGYLQFGAAIVLGLVVTPMVLRQVDPRAYGLWLAVGELLGYLALADIGVFAVLPWTIAEAEGRRDRDEIRVFMSNGVALGVALAIVTPACVAGVWFLAPSLLGLTPADRALIAGPLTILVAASIVGAPLAVFNAVLIGLQDVTFVGGAAVVRSVLMAAVTVILLARGWGLYALAVGAAIPTVLFACVNVFRVARTEPALLGRWPRPSASQIGRLVSEGIGGWLGGFGWRLSAMSSSLVLAATGRPELIAIYACTSKTTQLLLQLCWIVPDSALVGLVQIHGEGRAARRREITDALLKLYLVLAGGVAILVLAVNPSFVRWWVGAEFFGGTALNVLLAVSLVVSSSAHAVAALGSALGRRLELGAAGLLQGGAHVLMAIGLALWLGLEGLVAAAIVSAAITMIPIGLRTLRMVADLAPSHVGRDVAAWSWRALPVLAAAAATGASGVGLWTTTAASVALGTAYLWLTRSLYAELPIDSRYRRLLAAVRLA
jgi:O-antigen/teichoic acid export membrane protein